MGINIYPHRLRQRPTILYFLFCSILLNPLFVTGKYTHSDEEHEHDSDNDTSEGEDDGSTAWNGQTTNGSDTTQDDLVPFLPYWVPYGATGIDCNDTSITYSRSHGDWHIGYSKDYVGGSQHWTEVPGASISFSFNGTAIEWYATTSPIHGFAAIWLDGKNIGVVDCYSDRIYDQQFLYRSDALKHGWHTIKINVLGTKNPASKGHRVSMDAFVVANMKPLAGLLTRKRRQIEEVADILTTAPSRRNTGADIIDAPPFFNKRLKSPLTYDNMWSTGETSLTQTGELGVSAMQIAVVDDTHAIIIDKVEHNILSVNGHPAWGSIYDFTRHQERPLNLQSNSFCAGGSWLGNGTLINVGGNPVKSDHTGSADFGDVNGLQAIRMFDPCGDNGGNGDSISNSSGQGICDIKEYPQTMRMASARWYSTVARLSDGSAIIMGGAIKGGWINNSTVNNPTIEYYPPKNIAGSNGLPIQSAFFTETLNANLFPIVFHLPDDRIFVAANTKAMIYDWKINGEQRLPGIPNGVRITYPMTAGSVMLPLSEKYAYTPEILICGGAIIDDTLSSWDIDSQTPASDQCIRMILNEAGIAAGWQVEHMPQARLMPDLVLLPNGDVLIVNGAQTGVAGYGNVRNQAGQSNADNPAYTPIVYRPSNPPGMRFLTDVAMPTSNIARLYHSVATLLPSGDILIAGSNPNLDRTIAAFPTEYRLETLSPPYMHAVRPSFSEMPPSISYGQPFILRTDMTANIPLETVQIALMDLGFITHSIHMNSRLVYLTPTLLSNDGLLHINGPPSPTIYPPGPAWLYVLQDGIPSSGRKVMIGNRDGPPVDQAAVQNVLQSTQPIAQPKSS